MNAVFLCEDDRLSMFLLFLARECCNNGHRELFDNFGSIVSSAVEGLEQKLSGSIPEGKQRRNFFGHIPESEGN